LRKQGGQVIPIWDFGPRIADFNVLKKVGTFLVFRTRKLTFCSMFNEKKLKIQGSGSEIGSDLPDGREAVFSKIRPENKVF
jgi:hypothetical protein